MSSTGNVAIAQAEWKLEDTQALDSNWKSQLGFGVFSLFRRYISRWPRVARLDPPTDGFITATISRHFGTLPKFQISRPINRVCNINEWPVNLSEPCTQHFHTFKKKKHLARSQQDRNDEELESHSMRLINFRSWLKFNFTQTNRKISARLTLIPNEVSIRLGSSILNPSTQDSNDVKLKSHSIHFIHFKTWLKFNLKF